MEGHMRLGILAILLIIIAWVIAAKPVYIETGVKPDFVDGENPAGKTINIPEYAIEVAPGVYSLGTAVYEGKLVEGYAFVRYKDGYGKPSGCNYNGKCQGWEDATCDDCIGSTDPEPESTCYEFLSKGARWRTVEPYVFNPSNSEGLDENFVFDEFASDIQKWETAAREDIIGSGSMTTLPLSADYLMPDGRNEVYFGDVGNSNAIAVTVVWGIFWGPPSSRELVEWDHIYDQVDFDWSTSGEAGKMDFENIATHELGHSVGLGDLYTVGCSEETMYGYARNGETKKRTLHAGDIVGVRILYK